MPFSPRYGGQPVIDIDAVVTDPYEAFARQRGRLAETLAGLNTAEWNSPSRCGGWTVQDVIEHLVGVNRFFAVSLESGLRNQPTRLLASFDPVAVPAAMVDAARGAPTPDTLDRFVTTNDALADLLGGLSGADWSTPAEAPPGHLAARAVVAHALWDSWIHERDVLVPLSRVQEIETDEVSTSLVYVAALGPGLSCAAGSTKTGTLAVVAHDPAIGFSVDIGHEATVRAGAGAGAGAGHRATATIEGDAVGLLEALSYRSPMLAMDRRHRWLLGGLGHVFGQDT
ncbi:MAG: maleylpyruvate isomerase family mycothiol-dependent enzyme [Acidimicrobiales bacterium]